MYANGSCGTSAIPSSAANVLPMSASVASGGAFLVTTNRYFTNTINRYMNTPLSVLRLQLEGLEDGIEQPTPATLHSLAEEVGLMTRLVDDLIDTAGTLVKGAEALLGMGAASVSACATHAVLSGPALERIESSELKELVFWPPWVAIRARECRPA
jgi:signal transduction histidine kinase